MQSFETFGAADQDTVPATLRVMFGLRGMGVAPAGVDVPNTGHHHLLIDQPDSLDYEQPLPSTPQVVHFGNGQTEIVLALAPGTHRLQLLLADVVHLPHAPPKRTLPVGARAAGVDATFGQGRRDAEGVNQFPPSAAQRRLGMPQFDPLLPVSPHLTQDGFIHSSGYARVS